MCRAKRNHRFLFHYQTRGANIDKPLKILRRGPITYYSINFDQHSDFYNFFDAEKTVVGFFSVKNKSVVTDNLEVQGSVSLVNCQPAESNIVIELEDQRIWLTNVYSCFFLSEFIREKLKEEFMRRVIISGQSGSSCRFKRFQR